MTGIYKITNKINGHCYVGQSVDIRKRWTKHRNASTKETPYPLYLAFDKYGIDNFDFEIIEECTTEMLDDREKYWIAYYDSYRNGYNQTAGGQGQSCRGNKLTIDEVMEIDNYLALSSFTQKQIADIYNVSEEIVQGINTGRYWKRTIEYPIRPKQSSVPNYCTICGKEIGRQSVYCVECARIHSRKVDRPSKEQLLEDLLYNSFTAVGNKYNVTDNTIRKWCKGYGIPASAKEIKAFKTSQTPVANKKIYMIRKVAQIDVETNSIIAIHDSAAAAARSIGKNDGTHISACCNKKRKSAYGFLWEFVE